MSICFTCGSASTLTINTKQGASQKFYICPTLSAVAAVYRGALGDEFKVSQNGANYAVDVTACTPGQNPQ